MAASTPSGPSSRNVVTPASASACTPSVKRTVSRTWRTQYSGLHTSSSVASSPVTFDTTGICGAEKESPDTTCRKSSSMGSIRGEWNAWLTVSRSVLRPSAASRSATASTAVSSPAMTSESGPLTAAIATPSTRRPVTSASVAWTATMAPPVGSACISRALAATRVHASGSERTPATWAAAISPMEWPATKSGRRPQDSTRR